VNSYDIGCGNGEFLRKAQELGWEAWGTDADEKALEIAKQTGAKVVHGNLPDTGLTSEFFDFVTMSHVIEHVHEPFAALTEVFRVLKPGGTLWLATPNLNSLGQKRFRSDWLPLDTPRHLALFTPSSIGMLLAKSGFTNIRYNPCAPHAVSIYQSSMRISRNQNPYDPNGDIPNLKMRLIAMADDVKSLLNHGVNEFIITTASRP
jgi:SAM-dependent methyltransferase